MKIIEAKAFIKNLRLKKPYTIARQQIEDVENVFLEIKLENGITGIGAANPEFEVVGESPADTLINLENEIVPWLTGKDIRSFNALIDSVNTKLPHKPGTLACLDIALHDTFGKFIDMPVADFYGRCHHSLPTSVTIGILNMQQTLEEATAFKALGFRILKLKTGVSPEEDAEKVIRLREKFGNYFTIRVDANTGYTIAQLQHFINLTRKQPVELIEQPLAASHDKALENLPFSTRKFLAADESLKDAASAFALCKSERYGIYNIKLMKCGGIKSAFNIASVVESAGAKLFWGCNDESIISITAALHAAYACSHTRYIDLDGSFDLAEDIVEGGFIVKDGMMSITNTPGLGFKKI
ncbi:MAG: dipeptide epimerase [Chitinophagaceae bacterium]|nr:dipeptide epimerase [Chitinophagaceae bacterium]